MVRNEVRIICMHICIYLCIIGDIVAGELRNIRFSKPNEPIETLRNASLLDEKKSSHRKLGDELMNELFSGQYVDGFSLVHRRDQSSGSGEINTMDSLLKENVNTLNSVSNLKKTHSSPDGDGSFNEGRYAANDVEKVYETEEEEMEAKKLLLKEIVTAYEGINEEDVVKKGLVQLTVYGSPNYETNRLSGIANKFKVANDYQILQSDLATRDGSVVGSIRGSCYYLIPKEEESMCILGLTFSNEAGVEVGTLHLQGTILMETEAVTSLFGVTGGVGVFAGASGSAVFDQTLNEYSLFENKWIITLYEYWDNPLIESILDNSRIVFN